MRTTSAFLAALCAWIPTAGDAQDRRAFFGEQHVHTAYSLDAYIGGARLTPSDAYLFAKGGEVEVNGVKFKLRRPLDWAAPRSESG